MPLLPSYSFSRGDLPAQTTTTTRGRRAERDAGNRERKRRAASERDEAPFEDRRFLPLLAEKAVSDERDAEERVTDADDRVADCGAVGEARDDLADSQADGEGRECAAPPGEVRSLTLRAESGARRRRDPRTLLASRRPSVTRRSLFTSLG